MVCWSRMPLKIWRILQPSPRKMHRTLHTISQGSWIPRIIHENPFLDGEALTFSNYKKIYWPRKNGAWHNPPTIKSESIGLFNKLVRLAVLFLQLHSLGFLVPTEDRLESSKAFLLLFLSSPPGFPFLHHHFQCWLLIISLLCLKHFNDLPSHSSVWNTSMIYHLLQDKVQAPQHAFKVIHLPPLIWLISLHSFWV